MTESTAGNSAAERLLDAYWEQFAEEQIDLGAFCRRARQGEFGPCSADDLRDFLREIEANILHNIDTMLHANPQLAPLREERMEETHEMIADLIERYAAEDGGVDGAPEF